MDLSVPFVQQICKECGFDQREVERLSLSGEHIARLGKGLSGCESLIVLDISRNLLTSLQGIEHAKQLRKLNIAHNKIASVEELARLRHLPNLVDVDLRENPVCNKPEFDSVVIANVRKLRILNGEPLSAARVQQVRQQQVTAQQNRTREDRKQAAGTDAHAEDDVLVLLNNEIISNGATAAATEPTASVQESSNKSTLILQALDQRIRIWETQFGLNKPSHRLDDSSSSGDELDATTAAVSRPQQGDVANRRKGPQPRPSSSPARRSTDSGSVTLARESGEGILKVKPPIPASAPGSPNQRPKSARTTNVIAQTRTSTGSASSIDQMSPLRQSHKQHSSPARVRFASESSTEQQNSVRLSSDQLRQEFAKAVIQQMKAALDEIAQEAIGRMEAVASSITIPPPPPVPSSAGSDVIQLIELQSTSAQTLDSLAAQVQEMQHSLKTITTALLGVSEQQRATSAEMSQLGPQVRASTAEANIKWQSCLDSIRQLEQMLCGPGGVVLTLQRTNDELLQRVGCLQQELEASKTQHRLEMELLQKQFDELAAATMSRSTTQPAAAAPTMPTARAASMHLSPPMAARPATGGGSPERRKPPSASSNRCSSHISEAARISQQFQLDLKPL